MSIRDDAANILKAATQLARLAHQTEQQLLTEQYDAIAPTTNPNSSGSRNGHSDPTPLLAARLAPFHARAHQIHIALSTVEKALHDAHRALQTPISPPADPLPGLNQPRCPGWNLELQTRLGGCGNHIAYYRLANGNTQPRPEGLCERCRTAQRRHNQTETSRT